MSRQEQRLGRSVQRSGTVQRAAMQRHVSGPARGLLDQAGLPPQDVDQALDALAAGRASTVLRSHHPLLQHIGKTTGINVVQIARRSRYLLVEVEQHRAGKPAWQYRERSPRSCTFSCRGQLPATIEEALNGELFEKLVKPAIAMTGTLISNVGETGDGWLSVAVAPPWHPF